jgi:hypothetical protein
MAVTKGKLFEYALLYEGVSRAVPQPSAWASIERNYDNVPNDVRTAGQNAFTAVCNLALGTNYTAPQQQEFCATFQAGPRTQSLIEGDAGEPKTDVLCGNRNEYKFSLKYGRSYLLASPSLESSVALLSTVVYNVLNRAVDLNSDDAGAKALMGFLVAIDELGIEKGAQPADVILPAMESLGPLTESLQTALGSGRSRTPDELYLNINRAVVKELLTGELTFGRTNVATANYALNGPNIAIHEIDEDYINHMVENSSVRISRKGRTHGRHEVSFWCDARDTSQPR